MANAAETRKADVYLPGHKSEHITVHEWRTAENSSAYLLPTLIAMAKDKPNLRLLDCGAGPGSISASLATYIPQGEVLSTDFSPEVVERAAAFAKSKGVTNMKCEVANIFELPYPDDSFDVVHVQQVLTHLSQPLAALKSLLRVCRPGGVVAVREVDMRMLTFHPSTPELAAAQDIIRKGMQASGGSLDMGVRLVSVALQAGIPRDRIQASMGAWCYSTPEERRLYSAQFRDRLRNSAQRAKALEEGWATEEQLGGMVKAWDDWAAAEDGVFGLLNGEIIITK